MLLHDLRREFHPAEVFVAGVGRVEEHIAEHRIVDPRFNPFDHVLIVDVAVDLRLVLAGECEDGILLSANGLRRDCGVVSTSCSKKTIRRHRNFQLLDPGRIRGDDDRLALLLFTDDRLLASSTRRILALHADAIHA